MNSLKTDCINKIHLIDKYCRYQNGEIYNDYSCTLNQTVISHNKNKFYIMQIINLNNELIHYIRYGRIGEMGKISYRTFYSKQSAINSFEKQFRLKTKNNWANRYNFIKVDNKYYLTDASITSVGNTEQIDIKSKLQDRIQFLIKMISDIEIINKTLRNLEIDTDKLPLGNISETQISSADSILKQIKKFLENIVKCNEICRLETEQNNFLMNLSSKFYTYVPSSFGRKKKPPVINNNKLIGEYTNMLDELRSIIKTIQIINLSKKDITKHYYDTIYENLCAEITPLNKESIMWVNIKKYIKNTHGPSHKFKIQLIDIYEINRKSSNNYESINQIGNKMLLWHGSRMTNYCSIFQNGLVLNPENLGAVLTGKMFGQGIYLTNVFSKSVGYTACETSNDIGAILLCEVALGNQLIKLSADYTISNDFLKKNGYDSVYAKGKYSASKFITSGDMKIPNYYLSESKEERLLLYDEMVIYNTDQLILKYLVLFCKI